MARVVVSSAPPKPMITLPLLPAPGALAKRLRGGSVWPTMGASPREA
jgi:hypothetical protein